LLKKRTTVRITSPGLAFAGAKIFVSILKVMQDFLPNRPRSSGCYGMSCYGMIGAMDPALN
jgi:hypothetical protein